MASGLGEIALTEMLRRYGSGDRAVGDELFREIWPALHDLAQRQLSRERAYAPVSATELISELWLRNLNRGGWSVTNRQHFFAIVSISMRRVLVDLARRRLSASRGGGLAFYPLDEDLASSETPVETLEQVIQLGAFMEKLEKEDALSALIADMRYFAGYSVEEISRATQLTPRQVAYNWRKTEKRLKKYLFF